MSSNYTIEITKLGAAALDGTTPLNPTGAGVIVNRNTRPGVIAVTVPDGTDLGAFDPGVFVGSNELYYLTGFSIASDGGPVLPGTVLGLLGPAAPGGGRELLPINDLGSFAGVNLTPFPVPLDHLLSFAGAQAGPHKIVISVQPVRSEDIGTLQFAAGSLIDVTQGVARATFAGGFTTDGAGGFSDTFGNVTGVSISGTAVRLSFPDLGTTDFGVNALATPIGGGAVGYTYDIVSSTTVDLQPIDAAGAAVDAAAVIVGGSFQIITGPDLLP